MIATLKYNLDDESDRFEHACALKGKAMKFALDEFDGKLRSITKYGDSEMEKLNGIEAAEVLRDTLREIINEYDARVEE